jgi:hypothetical protein
MDSNLAYSPIRITISQNKFEAYLTIEENYRVFPTEAEVKAELLNAGVVFGIDNQTIREIIYARRPVHDVLIATGQNPFDEYGRNLIWYVNFARPLRPKITGLVKPIQTVKPAGFCPEESGNRFARSGFGGDRKNRHR